MSFPTSLCQNCGHAFATFGEKLCPDCGRVRTEKTMTGASEESYTVKKRDGSEIGPVPLEAVRYMMKQGVIDRDTPIRVGSSGRVVFPDELPPPLLSLKPTAPAPPAPAQPQNTSLTAEQSSRNQRQNIVVLSVFGLLFLALFIYGAFRIAANRVPDTRTQEQKDEAATQVQVKLIENMSRR